MKKNFLALLVTGLFMVGTVSVASATPYTDKVVLDESLQPGDSIEWQFDLTDTGFDFNTEIITSAEVKIRFQRVNQDDDFVTFTFSPRGQNIGDVFNFEAGPNGPWIGVLTIFESLQTNGKSWAELSVDANSSQVRAIDPTLTVNTASVPEPASTLLIGSGIAGLIGFRLRRQKKA